MRTTRYRIGGGGAGGGLPTECTPTVVWTDTFGIDDFLKIIYSVPFFDSFGMTEDALGVKVKLFDTFGMDDDLSHADVSALQAETFGISDGALGVLVKLFETMGMDDRLSLVQAVVRYVDTFGVDDRLTLATITSVYADTFGITDNLFADVFASQADTFALTEDALGVKTTLQETAPLWFDYVVQTLQGEGIQVSDYTEAGITGDLEVVVGVAEPDWTPTGFPVWVSKWGAAGQRSWVFEFDGTGTGKPLFAWTANGTTVLSAASTVAVPTADGELILLKATIDVDVGGTQRTITFLWKATTYARAGVNAVDLTGWTVLDTVTQAGTTSIFDSNAPIAFGSLANGGTPTAKKLASVNLRNGIGGTLVLDWRATDATGPYDPLFERALGKVVVVNSRIARPRSRYGPYLNLQDVLHVNLAPVAIDTIALDDAFPKAMIRNWTCGRSGTPDTDPCGDGWTDQASTGTNHGNETPVIVKGKSTLANDERRGFFLFDFTRYANMTAFVGGTHQLILRVTNTDLVLNATITVTVRMTATRPFTESTLNWTNQPAIGHGTAITSEANAVSANTTVDMAIELTDAQLNTLLGGWCSIYCTLPSAAAPPVFNIVSREGVTVSQRPRWEYDLKR